MLVAETAVQEGVDFADQETRKKLAQIVTNLFRLWQIDTTTQLNLLGLSPTSRAMLAKYRKGEAGLPFSRDTLDRVGWLLSIHKALRLFYPQNEELRYNWIHRRNQDFGNSRPLEMMTEQGLIGVAKVARYLDFQRGL